MQLKLAATFSSIVLAIAANFASAEQNPQQPQPAQSEQQVPALRLTSKNRTRLKYQAPFSSCWVGRIRRLTPLPFSKVRRTGLACNVCPQALRHLPEGQLVWEATYANNIAELRAGKTHHGIFLDQKLVETVADEKAQGTGNVPVK